MWRIALQITLRRSLQSNPFSALSRQAYEIVGLFVSDVRHMCRKVYKIEYMLHVIG